MNDPAFHSEIQRGSTPSPPAPQVQGIPSKDSSEESSDGPIRYGPKGTVYDRESRSFVNASGNIQVGIKPSGDEPRRGQRNRVVVTNPPDAPQATNKGRAHGTSSEAYNEAIDAPSESPSNGSEGIDSTMFSMDLAALDDHHPATDYDFGNVGVANKRRIRVPKVKVPAKQRRKKIRLTALGYCVVIFFLLAVGLGVAYVLVPAGTISRSVALLVDSDGDSMKASGAVNVPVDENLEDAVIQSEVEQMCHVDRAALKASQELQEKCLNVCQIAECCFDTNSKIIALPLVTYQPHCPSASSVRCELYAWCEVLAEITSFGTSTKSNLRPADSPSLVEEEETMVTATAAAAPSKTNTPSEADEFNAGSAGVTDFIEKACDKDRQNLSLSDYRMPCAKACSVARCCWDLSQVEDCSQNSFCAPYFECAVLLDYQEQSSSQNPSSTKELDETEAADDNEEYEVDGVLLTGQVEHLCDSVDTAQEQCLRICRPSECCFNSEIPCAPHLVGCDPYVFCDVLFDTTDFATLRTSN
jgi:hypothetical protein